MRNGIKGFWICFVLVVSFLLPSMMLAAQTTAATTSDWSALKAVTSGSKLSVRLKNGKTVEGKLNSVSDAALMLSIKNSVQDLKREDVLSVYQLTKKSATKATLIGMGVGAGAGAAIGAAGGANDGSGFEKIDHAVTAGLTVIGAGLGALTGYLVGRGGSKRVLVYESK
jgi:small nuclear ribonucleoprotein (snRNP)-like protein